MKTVLSYREAQIYLFSKISNPSRVIYEMEIFKNRNFIAKNELDKILNSI